ncbi:UDP-glucose/GDP-mannose dehydrogenase family, UDP binding domain [compost metagenome]
MRNTKIAEVIRELNSYGIITEVYDPWADAAEVKHEYNIDLIPQPADDRYDAVVLGVAHEQFLTLDFDRIKKQKAVVYDVKSFLPFAVDGSL